MEWKDQFDAVILKRGLDYDRRGLVVDLHQLAENRVQAIVEGSELYQVVIEKRGDQLISATCDCPYAAEDRYCKHMAAVLYALEDQDDQDEMGPTTIKALVAMATDQTVRDFLTTVLQKDGQLAARFELAVMGLSAHHGSTAAYQAQLDDIFEDYTDEANFIDYEAATDFGADLFDWFNDELQPLIDEGQLDLALDLVNYLVLQLAQIDIDDSDGEIMTLAAESQNAWAQILSRADQTLKERAFVWFQAQSKPSAEAFEDDIEDALFNYFTEPSFLERLLTWTAEKIVQAKRQSTDDWRDDYETSKWVGYRLQVMGQLKLPKAEIKAFCAPYLNRSLILKRYVQYCLQQGDDKEAISLLVDGKKQHTFGPLAAEYSRQLIGIYQRLAQPEHVIHELWQLLTEYDPAKLDDYKALKQHYSASEWPMQREKLFEAMPADADLKPLYAEDNLYRQLLTALLAADDLWDFHTYEALLKPKFSDQLLEKQAQVVRAMAVKTNTRAYYGRLVDILNHMLSYPNGPMVTREIVQEWRTKYPRRSAMLDELRQFKG